MPQQPSSRPPAELNESDDNQAETPPAPLVWDNIRVLSPLPVPRRPSDFSIH